MPVNQNIFISHHGKDDDSIKEIKSLLQKNGKEVRNSSIDASKPNNANNPDYIKSILRDRIRWSSAVLVLIGKQTHSREWVNWEVEEANRQGRVIVGLYLNGGTDHEIPEALENFADAVVGWRAKNLIDALEGKYTNWETADGEDRESPWGPSGVNC